MDAYFFESLMRAVIVFHINWQLLSIGYIIYVTFLLRIIISFDCKLNWKIFDFYQVSGSFAITIIKVSFSPIFSILHIHYLANCFICICYHLCHKISMTRQILFVTQFVILIWQFKKIPQLLSHDWIYWFNKLNDYICFILRKLFCYNI